MLRLVFTLDCDRCRQSYEKGAVCTDSETLLWESFAHDLKTCAAIDGWDCENEIVCDECLELESDETDVEISTSR